MRFSSPSLGIPSRVIGNRSCKSVKICTTISRTSLLVFLHLDSPSNVGNRICECNGFKVKIKLGTELSLTE